MLSIIFKKFRYCLIDILTISCITISSAFAAPNAPQSIAYMAYNSGIAMIDTTTHQYIGNVKGDFAQDDFTYLALTPDKKTLYALQSFDHRVSYIDTETNQKIGDVTGLPYNSARPRSISISPDGKK